MEAGVHMVEVRSPARTSPRLIDRQRTQPAGWPSHS